MNDNKEEKRALNKRARLLEVRVNKLMTDMCRGRNADGIKHDCGAFPIFDASVNELNNCLINAITLCIVGTVFDKLGILKTTDPSALEKLKDENVRENRINMAKSSVKGQVGELSEDTWDEIERNVKYILKHVAKEDKLRND